MLRGADTLLQFGRIGLNPPEDGGVVHLYAAARQHELDMAVVDREHQISPNRQQDYPTLWSNRHQTNGLLSEFKGL
jgi:hypothetical protein